MERAPWVMTDGNSRAEKRVDHPSCLKPNRNSRGESHSVPRITARTLITRRRQILERSGGRAIGELAAARDGGEAADGRAGNGGPHVLAEISPGVREDLSGDRRERRTHGCGGRSRSAGSAGCDRGGAADYSVFAKIDGTVHFEHKTREKKQIRIEAAVGE